MALCRWRNERTYRNFPPLIYTLEAFGVYFKITYSCEMLFARAAGPRPPMTQHRDCVCPRANDEEATRTERNRRSLSEPVIFRSSIPNSSPAGRETESRLARNRH